MSHKRHLLWKIPLAIIGVLLGLLLLLLIAVAGIIASPAARKAVLEKGIVLANERTGLDIDLGRLYLSPFHHSPMALYRAYKGEADLPLTVEIDSLFVGHRGQDTLVYSHRLRLQATLMTSNGISDILSVPIAVERLTLDNTAFHSDSLITTVGVDVTVDSLTVSSPQLNIAKGQYPLHGARISGVYVGIDLRDTTAQDTTPMLLAFDIPDAQLRDIHFALTPIGLDIRTDTLSANVLVDVGSDVYDTRRIDAGHTTLTVGTLRLPFDTIYGNAYVNLERNLITSQGLHARSEEYDAEAHLTAAALNLDNMQVSVNGNANFRGSAARLRGYYGIDDEDYNVHLDIERVNLSPFIGDGKRVILAGEIDAKGKGFNPRSRTMQSNVKMHLTEAIYDNIDVSGLRLDAKLANRTVDGTLHLPVDIADDSLQLSALTEHQFRVSEFMTPERMQVDYAAQTVGAQAARLHLSDFDFRPSAFRLHFTTDSTTSLTLATDGLTADVTSPMHVMPLARQTQNLLNAIGDSAAITAITSLTDLSQLDTLRQQIPDFIANISLSRGSPVQNLIEKAGIDINTADLTVSSDARQTFLSVTASTNRQPQSPDSLRANSLRLPAISAKMQVAMTDGHTDASLNAATKLTDGLLTVHDLRTDADLRFDLKRLGNNISGNGRLTMDDLSFGELDFGKRTVDMTLAPSTLYENALKADVKLNDIPLEIADSIVRMPDLDFSGAIRAQATIDGLPRRFDVSAEVLPLNVSAAYKPYNVLLGLGETPIVLSHNKVDFNGLPIYGVDSTFIKLTGGMDIEKMQLDIRLAADSFAPVKLVKDGPIPVYGDLATDIKGSVTGPLDSIVADVDVTILPTTDITYPIDKKNLAQVKPHGTVNVRYQLAEDTLLLGGQVNMDDGIVRYSPKLYPVMPFNIDSGSHISFDGPIGNTRLDISASQRVKADVESSGEETRRVDFTTGVRVNGVVDSVGLHSIGFFLEAPDDETITAELAALDEDTRDGLAATLLATGMYVGQSNVAAQREGYVLSSIINSRINAAMANSKLGKFIDVDISSGQTNHAAGKTNDMNISISKSFFKDRLRVTLGTSISDNPEVNNTNGLLQSITADCKLNKQGNVMLRLFSGRDYNNILEGELYKSGIGVRAVKEWHRQKLFRGDSINRTYNLTADAGVAYRSNNSIGPDLTLKSSIKNLLGRGETFSVKGNGAYYWAIRSRYPGDPKRTSTYKFGINTSLVFPYLHWTGDDNPDGDTRYMLGYQYENIAGGYGVHKLSGSLTYFIRSSQYITHAFTPLSLSVVLMKAESDNLLSKAEDYPQLIKLIAGNEFVPSIGYTFTYNDYRATRAVNTMLEMGVKESGNIINGIYCLFGREWNDKEKPLGSITFNQFVKLSAELRNKFNLTDRVCFATRLYAGVNIPLGNSSAAPLSEAFYAGGPNGMRAAAPYAYGPGNFYSEKYNQNFFHAGDVKLEANFELRFPIVWKLYGTAFVDAGNVWNWTNAKDRLDGTSYQELVEKMQLYDNLNDGIANAHMARQIALGTGAGLRLDIDGLVIRLDIGVAIHSPYQTYKYDKDRKPDKSKPINAYFNIPSALDALRFNFGIGYPF